MNASTINAILRCGMTDVNLDDATFVIYNCETGDYVEVDAGFTIGEDAEDIVDVCAELGCENVEAVANIIRGFNDNDSELIRENCEHAGLSASLYGVTINIA